MRRATIIALACLAPIGSLLCPALPGDARPAGRKLELDQVVAASCHVNGCSGTAIEWEGACYIITAEHCFWVGQSVHFTTGDKLKGGIGTVIADDKDLDLSLVRVDRDDLTQLVTVPADLPSGEWSGVGYPKGKGPTRWRGKFLGAQRITNLPRPRWAYKIDSGRFDNGSSGSGVFRGGCLVGVATHMDKHDVIYAAPLHDIRGFLARAGRDKPQPRLAKDGAALGLQAAGEDDPRRWGDRDRTREILALKEQLKNLKAGTGDPGPPGPAGPPGPGMDPATLSQILKRLDLLEDWTQNFRATVRVRVHPKEQENGE